MYGLLSELVASSPDQGSLLIYTLCIAFLLLAWRLPPILARQWTAHAQARWQHEFNMRLLDIIEEANRAAPAAKPSKPKLAPPQPFDLEAKGLTPGCVGTDHFSVDCDTGN